MKKAVKRRTRVGATPEANAQRRKDFVNMYFIHNQNGTAAALACGYSSKIANNRACALLREPWVKAEIQKRRDKLSEYIALTAEEVMRSLGRAMRFDPGKLYRPDGTLMKIHEIDEDTRLELEGADIDSVVNRKTGAVVTTSKVRYAKKSVARDQAMKHFRLFPTEKEQGGDDEVPTPVSVTIEFKDARLKKE